MPSLSTDAIYYHAFNLLPQIGARRLTKIARHFKNIQQAWESRPGEWGSIDLDKNLVESILAHRGKVDLESILEILNKHQIQLVTWEDEDYPYLLKEISDAPPLLYYKGKLPPPDSLAVAVVGTRKITTYGKLATQIITKPLARSGCVIVSGLAFGVDGAAHNAALEAGGITVAVLGGGLDDHSIYPREHSLLAQRIIDSGGCVMSEHVPGSASLKGNFVARNRIVSGLSAASIIVESDLQSGALITAKFALEQNRLVFAVPGPITSPASNGPNRLIQQGARPFLDAGEVLAELNISANIQTETSETIAKVLPVLNAQENILLQLLDNEPKFPDELIIQSELSASQVASALGMLELKGLARNLGANQYVRVNF